MKAFLPVILIVVALGLFFLQVTGLYADVKQLRAESAEYDVAIEKARELETVRAQLAQTLESFSPADLERLDHFLPKNLDTVRIILDVDGIADKNGVRLNGLKVGEPVTAQKAAPKGASAAAGNVGSGKVTHSAVDVSFNFTATYPKGVSFIQDLQRSLRLLDVTNLKINPSQETSGTYNFDVKLQTYWLNR